MEEEEEKKRDGEEEEEEEEEDVDDFLRGQIDVVVPGLYQSNWRGAENLEKLKDLGITHVSDEQTRNAADSPLLLSILSHSPFSFPSSSPPLSFSPSRLSFRS